MAELKIVKSEEMTNDGQYAAMVEKMKAYSDLMNAVMSFIMTIGGVRWDVLEFLSEHPYTDKKIFLGTRKLFNDGASADWFEFIEEVAKEKTGSVVYMFLDEIIYAYGDEIPLEVVKKYYSQCQNVYEMGYTRRQITGKTGTSYESVMQTLEGITRVLEEMSSDNTAYKDNVGELSEYMKEQNNKLKEYEADRNKNQKISEEQNEIKRKLEKSLAETEFYKEHYNFANEEFFKINTAYTQLKFEMQHLKDETTKKTVLNNDNESILLDLLRESNSKVSYVEKFVKNVKPENIGSISDELLQFMNSKFTALEHMLLEVPKTTQAENNVDSSWKRMNEPSANLAQSDEIKIIADNVPETTKEDSFEEPVLGKSTNIEVSENIENKEDTFDEKRKMPIVSEKKEKVEVKESESGAGINPLLKDGIQTIKGNIDEQGKRIIFIDRFLKKISKSKFVKMDEKEQKEALFKKMIELKYGKEQINYIKKAIKVGNSLEFIYTLVENGVSIEDLKSLCSMNGDDAMPDNCSSGAG